MSHFENELIPASRAEIETGGKELIHNIVDFFQREHEILSGPSLKDRSCLPDISIVDPATNEERITLARAANPYSIQVSDNHASPQRQIRTEGRPVFEHPADPVRDIHPAQIKQGRIGDCYFLSSLAALAQQHPEAIQKMIAQNDDGTYTVTFPGDPTHPVTVSRPSGAELKDYGHYGSGTWVSVIEKAHRKYTNKWAPEVGKEGSWQAEAGDDPQKAIKLLTGKDSSTDLTSAMAALTLERIIKEDLKAKKLMVASTGEKEGVPDSAVPPTKIVSGHAYTVMGFDSDHHRVILRNPWGYNENSLGSTSSGQFSMSVDEFQKYFPYLSRER